MNQGFISAGPPPSGVVPNPAHPDSFASVAVGTMSALIVVTVIAIAARLFTKIHVIGKVTYDDYMLLLAAILSIVYNLMYCVPSIMREARHMWELPRSSLALENQISNPSGVIWCVAVLLVNAVVVLQLQYVFAVQRYSRVWWAAQICLWVNTVVYTAATIVVIVICTPAQNLNIAMVYVSTAAINIILNCTLLAIPLLGIWTLQITARQKFTVMVMFGVNILAIGCAIGRLITSVKLPDTDDLSRDAIIGAYWAAAELVFFILAAVFPTLPRLWQWCKGHDNKPTPVPGECPFAKSTYVGPSIEKSSTAASGSATDGSLVCPYANSANTSLVPADKGTNITSVGSNGPCRFPTCRPDEEGILRTVEVEVTSMV